MTIQDLNLPGIPNWKYFVLWWTRGKFIVPLVGKVMLVQVVMLELTAFSHSEKETVAICIETICTSVFPYPLKYV